MNSSIFFFSFLASLCADLLVVALIAFAKDYLQNLERELNDSDLDIKPALLDASLLRASKPQ